MARVVLPTNLDSQGLGPRNNVSHMWVKVP
jgi:hypothetical protein